MSIAVVLGMADLSQEERREGRRRLREDTNQVLKRLGIAPDQPGPERQFGPKKGVFTQYDAAKANTQDSSTTPGVEPTDPNPAPEDPKNSGGRKLK